MAPHGPGQVDRSLRGVLLVAGAALLLQALYHVLLCRYDLIEDEAHYWLWSRFPDWSYYSKGPGVAWAIWLSTRLFGNAEWAVRLPSAIAGGIGALAAGGLARDLSAWAHARAGQERSNAWASPARVGTFAAAGYALTPVLQGASVFATIDAPYVACWAIACWACWRALEGASPIVGPHDSSSAVTYSKSSWDSPPFWPLVGAAVALGFLFKYTMLLLLPGFVAFVLWRRRAVRGGAPAPMRLAAPFAIGVVLALAGLAPVLIWNAQQGWPTVKHLLGHLGLPGGDVPPSGSPDGGTKWSPWWLPELIVEQIGMVGPWLVLGALGAWRVLRPARTGQDAQGVLVTRDDPRRTPRMFLVCAALPILTFYAIVALIAEPEGNWPLAAYATLSPLAAWLAADAFQLRRVARAEGRRMLSRVRGRVVLWRTGLTYAIFVCLLVHGLDVAGDIALALDRRPWFHSAFVRLTKREPRDPAGRIRGAKEMAAHVDELLAGLRQQTRRPAFVLAQHYGRASQMAYYLRLEHPAVYCAMPQTGGRRSQFDIWPWTTLDVPRPELAGRPAVIVTSTQPYILDVWRRMFERVEPLPGGERLRGEAKPDRSALLGYGWKYQPPNQPTPPSASAPAADR